MSSKNWFEDIISRLAYIITALIISGFFISVFSDISSDFMLFEEIRDTWQYKTGFSLLFSGVSMMLFFVLLSVNDLFGIAKKLTDRKMLLLAADILTYRSRYFFWGGLIVASLSYPVFITL